METQELQPPAGRHWPKVAVAALVVAVAGGVGVYYEFDSWLHKESRAAHARHLETEKMLRETDEMRALQVEAELLEGITVENGYTAGEVLTARRRLQAIAERTREISPDFDSVLRKVDARRVNELEARERARRSGARTAPP